MILLYGGTFNPIHFGHIIPLQSLVELIKPNKLIYIPCHIPPHKTAPSISSQTRLEMTRLAIEESQFVCPVEVSDFELEQKGKSYTALTLSHFRELYPEESIAFVIGTDSLLSLNTWYEWEDIVESTTLYVLTRPGYVLEEQALPTAISSKIGDTIHLVSNIKVDLASTDLRMALAREANQLPDKQEPLSQMIPTCVLNFIERHQLYK